jgi:hypothetical protein
MEKVPKKFEKSRLVYERYEKRKELGLTHGTRDKCIKAFSLRFEVKQSIKVFFL